MSGLKILLVEDNPVVQRVMAQMLSAWPVEVLMAGSKAEALNLVDQHALSLILLDIGLPDGRGWEVVEHIQFNAEHRNREVPVLVISAHLREEERMFQLGRLKIERCMSKPVSIHRISVFIENLLNDFVSDRRQGMDKVCFGSSYGKDSVLFST